MTLLLQNTIDETRTYRQRAKVIKAQMLDEWDGVETAEELAERYIYQYEVGSVETDEILAIAEIIAIGGKYASKEKTQTSTVYTPTS